MSAQLLHLIEVLVVLVLQLTLGREQRNAESCLAQKVAVRLSAVSPAVEREASCLDQSPLLGQSVCFSLCPQDVSGASVVCVDVLRCLCVCLSPGVQAAPWTTTTGCCMS